MYWIYIMSPFYIAVSAILALSAVAWLVMTYMKELIALPHKEYILLVVSVLLIACYIMYRMMPARHFTDDQPKFYEPPYPWETCSPK